MPARWLFISRHRHHQPRGRRLISCQFRLIPCPCRIIPRRRGLIPCHRRLISRQSRLIPRQCRIKPPTMSVSMPLHRHFKSRCISRPLPHRRKIHAPSTENPPSIDGAYHPRQRHFYTGPNTSPRPHLTLITVSPSPQFPSFLFLSHFVPSISHSLLGINNHIHSHTHSLTISFNSSLYTSSSIYTVRASDSRFTSFSLSIYLPISLSLSHRTQTHSHTHYSLKNEKEFLFFSFFFFLLFFFSIFITRDKTAPETS